MQEGYRVPLNLNFLEKDIRSNVSILQIKPQSAVTGQLRFTWGCNILTNNRWWGRLSYYSVIYRIKLDCGWVLEPLEFMKKEEEAIKEYSRETPSHDEITQEMKTAPFWPMLCIRWGSHSLCIKGLILFLLNLLSLSQYKIKWAARGRADSFRDRKLNRLPARAAEGQHGGGGDVPVSVQTPVLLPLVLQKLLQLRLQRDFRQRPARRGHTQVRLRRRLRPPNGDPPGGGELSGRAERLLLRSGRKLRLAAPPVPAGPDGTGQGPSGGREDLPRGPGRPVRRLRGEVPLCVSAAGRRRREAAAGQQSPSAAAGPGAHGPFPRS